MFCLLFQSQKKMLIRGFFDKRGQVASGVSWMAATLVIIAILSISIFAASLMSKTKVVGYSESERQEDVVAVRSIFSYFVLEDSDLKSNILEVMREKDSEGNYYLDFDVEFNEINKMMQNN